MWTVLLRVMLFALKQVKKIPDASGHNRTNTQAFTPVSRIQFKNKSI